MKETNIPKIIHRIWTIWDPKKPDIPNIYQDFDLILKDLHPDWEFMEWDDEKILNFITEYYSEFLSTYLAYDEPVKRHDVSRYLIVAHFGGVFIQHSIKLQKNLELLLKGSDLVLSIQKKSSMYIANGFFASVPQHKFWKIFIKNLPKISNLHVLEATGPKALSASIERYLATKDTSIKILNHKHLFPFNWEEKDNRENDMFMEIEKEIWKEMFPHYLSRIKFF